MQIKMDPGAWTAGPPNENQPRGAEERKGVPARTWAPAALGGDAVSSWHTSALEAAWGTCVCTHCCCHTGDSQGNKDFFSHSSILLQQNGVWIAACCLKLISFLLIRHSFGEDRRAASIKKSSLFLLSSAAIFCCPATFHGVFQLFFVYYGVTKWGEET